IPGRLDPGRILYASWELAVVRRSIYDAMKTLLNDQYAPLTSAVGLLEVPSERAARALYEWLQSLSNLTVGEALRLFTEDDPGTEVMLPSGVEPEEILGGVIAPAGPALACLPVEGQFPDILLNLEPLTWAVRSRELVLETDSRWTAYFANVA